MNGIQVGSNSNNSNNGNPDPDFGTALGERVARLEGVSARTSADTPSFMLTALCLRMRAGRCMDQRKGKANAKTANPALFAIPFLKRFTVFNAAQCDGLPE